MPSGPRNEINIPKPLAIQADGKRYGIFKVSHTQFVRGAEDAIVALLAFGRTDPVLVAPVDVN